LVSSSTRELAGNDIAYDEVGELPLHGRSQPMTLYTPVL
jgi:class 3 adenylate cyclase